MGEQGINLTSGSGAGLSKTSRRESVKEKRRKSLIVRKVRGTEGQNLF